MARPATLGSLKGTSGGRKGIVTGEVEQGDMRDG